MRMSSSVHKVLHNHYLLASTWILLWMILLKVSSVSSLIPTVATGMLAVVCTQLVSAAVYSVTTRKIIARTSDKAVVITGCDSGFGYKLCVSLHKLGFRVFAGCLFPDGPGALSLQKATLDAPDRLQIMKLDVTSDEDVSNAFNQVKNSLLDNEQLWAVVNNAGIASIIEVEWCPLDVYRRLLDVNAFGPIRVTKAFLPLLRQTSGSRIVIVASLAGRFTLPGFSAYSMSKHAAVSFADALRLEMAKWNITVHTIEPTLYKTNIADIGHTQDMIDKLWTQCSGDIQDSYGEEYLQEFKKVITGHLSNARSSEAVCEVVDDMVDATAGVCPKTRYVPSLVTQVRERILSTIPVPVRDSLFIKTQPRTPPADVQRRTRIPAYKLPQRQTKRTISEPSREKSDLSPLLKSTPTNMESIFQFPTVIPSIEETEDEVDQVHNKTHSVMSSEDKCTVNKRSVNKDNITNNNIKCIDNNQQFTDFALGQRLVELR